MEASYYILPKYLLIMELRFNVILYSKLGNGNADASRIKCSRGPQVPNPCSVPVSQPFAATEFHSFVKKKRS